MAPTVNSYSIGFDTFPLLSVPLTIRQTQSPPFYHNIHIISNSSITQLSPFIFLFFFSTQVGNSYRSTVTSHRNFHAFKRAQNNAHPTHLQVIAIIRTQMDIFDFDIFQPQWFLLTKLLASASTEPSHLELTQSGNYSQIGKPTNSFNCERP